MPVFGYTARGRQGQSQHGQLTAASEEEALATLQGQGLLVTSVRLDRATKTSPLKTASTRQHHGIKIGDLVLFSKQLSTLLSSGVPLTRALNILKTQCESERLQQTLGDILTRVESGLPLHEALKQHARVFNDFWINLVKAGEAGGRLAGALEQIAKYLETIQLLHQKIISAMIYPLVLIVATIGAVALFLLKIVPIFSNLFKDFNVPLPWITIVVIRVSSILQHYALWGILIAGVFSYGVRRWYQTAAGRELIDTWMLRLPIIGELVQYSQVARFAHSLSTLLESGVPILQALEIVQSAAGNVRYAQAIEAIRTGVREGHSMTQPLAQGGLFPVMMVQMVQVGEEIGQVAQMLARVAKYYEERAETMINRVTTLFEPIVLVVMGGVIGVIVVAMYLPLFNLSQIRH